MEKDSINLGCKLYAQNSHKYAILSHFLLCGINEKKGKIRQFYIFQMDGCQCNGLKLRYPFSFHCA